MSNHVYAFNLPTAIAMLSPLSNSSTQVAQINTVLSFTKGWSNLDLESVLKTFETEDLHYYFFPRALCNEKLTRGDFFKKLDYGEYKKYSEKILPLFRSHKVSALVTQ